VTSAIDTFGERRDTPEAPQVHPGAGQAGGFGTGSTRRRPVSLLFHRPGWGEPFRRRNLFLLPADDDAVPATDDTEAR